MPLQDTAVGRTGPLQQDTPQGGRADPRHGLTGQNHGLEGGNVCAAPAESMIESAQLAIASNARACMHAGCTFARLNTGKWNTRQCLSVRHAVVMQLHTWQKSWSPCC